jgi:hypothetical protein
MPITPEGFLSQALSVNAQRTPPTIGADLAISGEWALGDLPVVMILLL